MIYGRIRDAYLITDPGFFRLWTAVRGTLTVVLSTLALFALSSHDHQPFLFGLIGALMAMNTALAVDEPTVRAQKRTAVLVPLFGMISVVVGVLVLPWRSVSIVILLLFTYFAIYLRKHGPRWNSVGSISYTCYFAALFFKVPLQQMTFVVEGIFISGILSYVIKFHLVPLSAQSAISWSLSAYRAGLRRFVRAVRRQLDDSSTLMLTREPLRSRIVRVNELALLSEDAILNSNDGVPGSQGLVRSLQGRVFDLELSARKIFELFEFRSRDLTRADLKRLEAGYGSLKSSERALVAEDVTASPLPSLSPLVATPTGVAKVRYMPLRNRIHPQTRQAIQATLATAIATLIGTEISADRWYWAPLTAFVVFTGTTRGDSLRRAFARFFGTASGVASGLALGYLLHGHATLELTVLFVSMFCAIFSVKASYAWYVFWLTSVIALFYSLLGLLTPGLLYLRIEQTLIGGVCGGLCAMFVLPVSSKHALRQELAKLFMMLSLILREIQESPLPRRERRTRVRSLERGLMTLQAIAGPLRGPLGRHVREETRTVVHGAGALVHFARQVIVFYREDSGGELSGESLEDTATRVRVLPTLSAKTQALAERIPHANFVEGEVWTTDTLLESEAPDISLMRLAQAISVFEARYPAHS